MNDDAPPSVDELISRHFDEALPLAEHQRLTAALDADVAARLDFVDTARLHAGLEALVPALPPVKKRYVGRWVVAGAAAAVMIGGGTWFWNQPRGGQVQITLQDMDVVPDDNAEKPKPTGLVKRVVKSPAAAFPAGAPVLDVQELLSRYYVNVSPSGRTVPEALGQLEDAIKEVNILRRPELDQLTFKAGAAIFSQPFDPVITQTAGIPMTVRQYLNRCAKFRQVLLEPGGQRYGDPEFPVRKTGDVSEQEKFQMERDRTLWLVKSMDLGLGAAPQRSVSLKFITLNRNLLPAGFDENTGMLMTDKAFQEFDGNLPKNAPQRCTNWIDHKLDPVFGTHLTYIDSIGSVWADIPRPDWLSIQYSFESSLQGEMIMVSGSVTSDGWRMGTETQKFKGPGQDAEANFDPGRISTCKPTDFEVWIQPEKKAIFALDSSSGDLVTIVCLFVEMTRTKFESRPSELYAPK